MKFPVTTARRGCHHTMSNPFPSRGGGPLLVDHHSHQPAWKQLHRSPFFWLAAACIGAAMTVYVMTSNLANVPGEKTQPPVPALTP